MHFIARRGLPESGPERGCAAILASYTGPKGGATLPALPLKLSSFSLQVSCMAAKCSRIWAVGAWRPGLNQEKWAEGRGDSLRSGSPPSIDSAPKRRIINLRQ